MNLSKLTLQLLLLLPLFGCMNSAPSSNDIVTAINTWRADFRNGQWASHIKISNLNIESCEYKEKTEELQRYPDTWHCTVTLTKDNRGYIYDSASYLIMDKVDGKWVLKSIVA